MSIAHNLTSDNSIDYDDTSDCDVNITSTIQDEDDTSALLLPAQLMRHQW